MARDLDINIKSKSDSAALDAAARNVDHLRREANRLGDEFKRASREAAGLDRQLLQTRAATAALAREFSKTSDPKVLAQLDQQRAALRDQLKLRRDILGDTEKDAAKAAKAFEKAFSDLKGKRADSRDQGVFGFFGDPVKDAEQAGGAAANTFAQVFEGGIIGAVKSLPPEAQGGIVAGIAGAVTLGAPVIASAVSAAVLLGVGGAGLAAGIALAAKDSTVQRAFSDLGQQATAGLTAAASPFRAQLVETAHIFSGAFDDIQPDLQDIFAELATDVQPLARGLAGLVKESLPGLKEAAKAVGPLFATLADEAPQIGKALSDFFGAVADAGPAANDTLKFILANVEALTYASAELVREAAPVVELYGKMDRAFFGAGDSAEGLGRKLSPLTMEFGHIDDVVLQSAESMRGLVAQINAVEVSADTLAGQMTGKIIGGLLASDQAVLGWEESLTRLTEAFQQNGRNIDIHTSKGQANREAILASVQANLAEYQSMIASGHGAEEAAAKYDANTAALESQLRKAHLTQGEIDGLIDKYRAVPDRVNTEIALKGLAQAIADLGDLIKFINNIPTSKNFTLYVHTSTSGGKEAGDKYSGGGSAVNTSGKERRALGGPVIAGREYLVGERGPELFRPALSGQIIPRVPDATLMTRWASAAGGPSSRPAPQIHISDAVLQQAFTAIFLQLVRKGQIPRSAFTG